MSAPTESTDCVTVWRETYLLVLGDRLRRATANGLTSRSHSDSAADYANQAATHMEAFLRRQARRRDE